ncbi:MAG: hypothetical protein AAB467_00305 [Patescibacteria group bacterium]
MAVSSILLMSFPCQGHSPTDKAPIKTKDGEVHAGNHHGSFTKQDMENLEKISAQYRSRENKKEALLRDIFIQAKKLGPEALEVYEFLKANFMTLCNVDGELEPYDTTRREQMVGLFIFMEDDLVRTPQLEKIQNEKFAIAHAFMAKDWPVMVVQTGHFPKLTMAVAILREGFHARRLYTLLKSGKKPTEMEKAIEDVLALEFAAKLISKIGGSRYDALINENVEQYLKTDLPLSGHETRDSKQRGVIGFITGSSTLTERELFYNAFRVDTKFRQIDRFFTDPVAATEYKAMVFMRWWEITL